VPYAVTDVPVTVAGSLACVALLLLWLERGRRVPPLLEFGAMLGLAVGAAMAIARTATSAARFRVVEPILQSVVSPGFDTWRGVSGLAVRASDGLLEFPMRSSLTGLPECGLVLLLSGLDAAVLPPSRLRGLVVAAAYFVVAYLVLDGILVAAWGSTADVLVISSPARIGVFIDRWLRLGMAAVAAWAAGAVEDAR